VLKDLLRVVDPVEDIIVEKVRKREERND